MIILSKTRRGDGAMGRVVKCSAPTLTLDGSGSLPGKPAPTRLMGKPTLSLPYRAVIPRTSLFSRIYGWWL